MRAIETKLTIYNAVLRTFSHDTSPLPRWLVQRNLNDTNRRIQADRRHTEEATPSVGHWRINVYPLGDGLLLHFVPGGFDECLAAAYEAAGRCGS